MLGTTFTLIDLYTLPIRERLGLSWMHDLIAFSSCIPNLAKVTRCAIENWLKMHRLDRAHTDHER